MHSSATTATIVAYIVRRSTLAKNIDNAWATGSTTSVAINTIHAFSSRRVPSLPNAEFPSLKFRIELPPTAKEIGKISNKRMPTALTRYFVQNHRAGDIGCPLQK